MQALLVPLRRQDAVRPSGFLVAARQPYRPARRRLPRLPRAARRPARHRSHRRARLPGGARAGGARSLELDRAKTDVLHQRQPRVPHPADAAARARPRTRWPTPATALADVQRERLELVAPQRRAAAAARQHAARLLPPRGRRRRRPVRAGRPGPVHGRARRQSFSARRAQGRPEAHRRLPAAAVAGLRRPRDVGEDRAQPAVERAEVHLHRRDHGAAAGGRRRGRARGRGHRCRRPGRGAGDAVRAVHPRRRHRRAQLRGAGIGLALVAELAAAARRPCGRAQHRRRAAARSPSRAARPRPPAGRPGRGGGADPRRQRPSARGYLAEALRWTAHRDGAEPGDRPRERRPGGAVGTVRRDRRPRARRARGCSSRTTTPTCATTSPGCSPGPTRCSSPVDGEAALELARAQPPDLVLTDVMMPRLDGFGLLLRCARDPLTSPRPGGHAVRPGGRGGDRRGPRRRAPTTTWSSRSRRASCWRGCAPTSSSTGCGAAGATSSAARSCSTRPSGWPRSAAGRSTWRAGRDRRLGRAGPPGADDRGGAGATRGRRTALRRPHPPRRPRPRSGACSSSRSRPARRSTTSVRLVLPTGEVRVFHVLGEVERDGAGAHRARARQQPGHHRAARGRAGARRRRRGRGGRRPRARHRRRAAAQPAARRRRPGRGAPTSPRTTGAGVEGTQVGGDWYDVIELGAGRTALVLGDVMGRGVRAAAVMGQLRSAVRAYARLDLPPADDARAPRRRRPRARRRPDRHVRLRRASTRTTAR